jgi:hypothetical protein
MHRPADNPARVAVHHRGKVKPSLPGAHVLDVCAPEAVRPGRLEVALDEIVGDTHARHADRRAPVTLRYQPRHAFAPHQPLHPFATDADAAVTQRPVHAPGAVGLAALDMDVADRSTSHASASSRSDGARRCQA